MKGMMRGSKLDEIMTLCFMLLAVAAVICFFTAGPTVFLSVGGVAVAVRLVQYLLRFIY